MGIQLKGEVTLISACLCAVQVGRYLVRQIETSVVLASADWERKKNLHNE